MHITDDGIMGNDKLQYRKENAIPFLESLGNWIAVTYAQVLPGAKIGKVRLLPEMRE